LVAPEILAYARDDAERIYVGKEPGVSAMKQEDINDLLVARALAGSTVVRLKGGDPFVFGRGAEEELACVRAGVPVEVVPAITSAIAAPGAAGIPVTHRRVARSFAVVTASTAHGDAEPPDLARLAGAVDTLVILMAAGKLAETCEELIAHGLKPTTPAAIVQWATTPDEKRVVGTLEELPALARAATVGPPATLIVGGVAALASELSWLRSAASDPDSRSRTAG